MATAHVFIATLFNQQRHILKPTNYDFPAKKFKHLSSYHTLKNPAHISHSHMYDLVAECSPITAWLRLVACRWDQGPCCS